MPDVAIVVALEREVRPLIRNWQGHEREHSGRRFRFFEKGNAVLVCGGIGAEAARRATEAIIALYRPSLVESAGFAGALEPSLRVGDVVEPRQVIDAGDGSRSETGIGSGTLVSFGSVAGREQKAKLARAFGALAVDMEAAAVARGATAYGLPFRALKVISDEAGFAMPAVEKFVVDGQFQTGAFAAHAALHPQLWAPLIHLARNSAKASRVLCACLEERIGRTETVLAGGSPHLNDAPPR
jgi:adenosylhomocysteine nucleosidase